ncbi:monocarboxylate transporter [Fusarium mundagurra]|uniref:Monocarboxylate transporter n=1 Tax=Fusarium mundagurra TaxID=1567541 RepID=A0A8H5YK85_9HYPO|nr:monocarboxylate transporter [Fusarium mundagurra]
MATNTVTTSSMDSSRQRDAMEMSSLSQSPLNTNEDTVRNEEEPPENARSAIPDGGYGWTIVASCFTILFWINGYTTAWGVLQADIVQSLRLYQFPNHYVRWEFVHGLYGRVWLAITTIFFGSGLIITSFTLEHLAGLFCIAGLLVGLSTSLLYNATNTMPTQWFSRKLGTANGIVKAGGGVGATVLPLATQAMIDKVGLQWTFRIIGASILVTGIPCAYLLTEFWRGGTTSRFDWSQLKSMPFLTLPMSGAVGVFALFVPPFFLPVFARSIGLSASTGIGLVAGFGASTAVGRLFGGWICDHMGAFNSLALAALINTPRPHARNKFFTPPSTPSFLEPLYNHQRVATMASKDPPVVPTKPTNINLSYHDEPTTILCREIEDIVGELPWLQSLNLLLTRITGTCYQTSDWRKSVVDEAKHTLLCLAGRRQLTGGRRVVTNEHLTRALYYFDVRMLLADVDDNHAGLPRDDFFRDFYTDCASNSAQEDSRPRSDNQPDATSLTSPMPKTETWNTAPSTAETTTQGTAETVTPEEWNPEQAEQGTAETVTPEEWNPEQAEQGNSKQGTPEESVPESKNFEIRIHYLSSNIWAIVTCSQSHMGTITISRVAAQV